MDGEPFDQQKIEQYKTLQTSGDIREAVLDLSRQTKGKVMIKLTMKGVSDGEAIWFGPGYAQEEYDNPNYHGNSMVKFAEEVSARDLRIVEVESIIMKSGASYAEAWKEFAQSKGFELTEPLGGRWYYSGRLHKKIIPLPVNTP